jgi:RNA polymerase sigma-70 factor (ECF subfamily)
VVSIARASLSADLARLQGGQRDAARAVFDALWPTLVAFARRALTDEQAEDAAQRALIKLFHQVHLYDARRDALSWAFAIASWEVRSIQRDAGRRSGDLRVESIEDLRASGGSVDDVVADAEMSALLEHAIAALPDLDRKTLLEMLEETSPRPALTPAVRKRRQRAIERLRAMWRSFYGPP